MGNAISRKASKGQQSEPAREPKREPKPAWGWRAIGLLLGLAILLVGAGTVVVNGVQGVRGTGLVGTRGTFTVDYCIDTNPSRKNSDYECGGDFAPRDGSADDGWSGKLENGDDYRAGTKLAVAEAWSSEWRFREVGVGAVLESGMWFCFGLVFLAMGFFQSRKWAKSFKN
ncbi:hypothetical protein [Streptomyces sp. CA-132043]|uniref:hypothetical protein n=1 Tax=Streptomyces sp. CA-132043 TaxID=3240048 RepID=UPI003D8FE279